MTDNPTPQPRNALSSLTLRGAIAMAVAFGVSKLGVDLPDGAAQAIADALGDLLFFAGLIAVGVGRARARGPLS